MTLTARDIPEVSAVPDVTGMGLKDALYLLEKAGLKVQVEGSGYVRRQSLRAGTRHTPAQTVYLQCSL